MLKRIRRQDEKISDDNSDVVFSLQDLVIEPFINNVEKVQLEAYKTKKNDLILSQKKSDEYDQLHWTSIGYPTLTVKKSSSGSSLFHFTNDGFFTHVEMLTENQKSMFADAAKRKYKIDVKKEQITTLVPSEFKCELEFSCDEEPIFLKGDVYNKKTWPLALKFKYGNYEKNTKECIKKYISDNLDSLELRCEILAQANSEQTNVFSINFKSENNNELVNELFGKSESIYVTRNQMDDFSQSIYSSMNVFEQYEQSEDQFNNIFVEDFIKQMSEDGFKSVPFEQAVNGISRFNIDKDIEPDEIISEYSKVFNVSQEGGKQQLIINKEQYERLNERKRDEHGGSVSGGFAGFTAGASYNQAKERQTESEKSGKSINDQLNEFNKQSDTTVEYKFDGKKVIPKSLKVAKLTKSKFKKSINFSRIKKTLKKYLFNTKFSLAVSNAEKVSSYIGLRESIQLLSQKLESMKICFIYFKILIFFNHFIF